MSEREEIAKKVAEQLLQIKAIKINPENPFKWASGWNSPIYCDNRKVLSYPDTRAQVCDFFVQTIEANYKDVEVIAGVATGGIALGVMVAERLNLPFVYVRAAAKKHGMQNLVEGALDPNKNIVVVEDLISTGMSSLNAVEALRESEANILGMVAIFTYGFEQASQNFEEANVDLQVLSNYNVLIEEATKLGYVSENNIKSLQEWRVNPSNWQAESLST